MGKINGCLRGLFIFFNALFAILGCVLISGATKSSAYRHQMAAVGTPGLIWLLAIGVLGISCLGIKAAFSKKKIILKIFAGFMVVGMIIILIFGIITVVTRNKIKPSFESIANKSAKSFKADEELRTLLEELQHGDHCCGVVSASDWGDDIPSSCKCSGYEGYGGSECTSKPQGVSGPDRIYAKPCKYILISTDLVFKIAMSVCFGFAITALLGLLLSCLLIHEVQHHDCPGESSIGLKGQCGDP